MIFGKDHLNTNDYPCLKVDDELIGYVDSIRYLGFNLKSGKKCSFSSEADLRSFHAASNGIVRSMKKPNEVVLLHLLYSNCVSILTYGCEVKEFSHREFLDLNTAVNLYIRKIFSFRWFQNTRVIRQQFGYRSLTELFDSARNRFQRSFASSANSFLCNLNKLCCCRS